MAKQVCIITGVSSGLGAELAILLLKQGYDVIGLSRTDNADIGKCTAVGKYAFYPIDLTLTDNITAVLQQITASFDSSSLEAITLINNAASVTPLAEIQHCTDEEIINNVQLNIAAPIILSSAFMRLTSGWQATRKIVNISSGSAKYPAPSMSLYCSAKAALNMFSRCIGMEQEQEGNGVQVCAIDPGMMDTPMQQAARESDMALSAYFAAQKEEGNLVDPARVARRIIQFISSPIPRNGEVYQVCEIE